MAPESDTRERRDPISPYSLRRKSVQVILAMALILIVNVTLLVQTIATGDRALVVLSMDKIFNPFYTTKPSGTGVGLGLSFSSDVVRQYGGSMTAESEPGEFTEMTVRLPAPGRDESVA